MLCLPLEMLVFVDMAHVESIVSPQREEGVKMATPTTSTDCHLVPGRYVKLVHHSLEKDAKQPCLIPKLWGWTELWRKCYILFKHRWIHHRAVTVMRQLKVEAQTRNRYQTVSMYRTLYIFVINQTAAITNFTVISHHMYFIILHG